MTSGDKKLIAPGKYDSKVKCKFRNHKPINLLLCTKVYQHNFQALMTDDVTYLVRYFNRVKSKVFVVFPSMVTELLPLNMNNLQFGPIHPTVSDLLQYSKSKHLILWQFYC